MEFARSLKKTLFFLFTLHVQSLEPQVIGSSIVGFQHVMPVPPFPCGVLVKYKPSYGGFLPKLLKGVLEFEPPTHVPEPVEMSVLKIEKLID